MELRQYQRVAVERLREQVRAGHRRVVLVAPTGAGKTVIAAHIIAGAVALGSRVVFIVHRREIVNQSLDKLTRFGAPAGVVMATDRRLDASAPVQVCSIATLARRRERPAATLVIIDECHHAVSDSYRRVLEAYAGDVVLGLTATPWRTDRLGLADVFSASVLAATYTELIANGSLVAYEAFAYDAPDLHEVRVTAGDYNQRELGLACNTAVLVGSVVREYVAHARGRRAILFPVNIEHSKSLVAELHAHGVLAAHLDCSTPAVERAAILTQFAAGTIHVVASVGVLTEGFDCPEAEVCILARPTKSLSLHLQMCGRVLRPSPDTGKTRALIHDHAGNLLRHGFPDDERDYSLTATPKRVRELHTCTACHAVFAALKDGRYCPYCGEHLAEPEPLAQGTKRRGLAAIGAARRLDADSVRAWRRQQNLLDLSPADALKVAQASRRDQVAEWLRLCFLVEERGWSPHWAAKAYRNVFGEYPDFSPEEIAGVAPGRVPFVRIPKRAA